VANRLDGVGERNGSVDHRGELSGVDQVGQGLEVGCRRHGDEGAHLLAQEQRHRDRRRTRSVVPNQCPPEVPLLGRSIPVGKADTVVCKAALT
jgi:hypothetical protein